MNIGNAFEKQAISGHGLINAGWHDDGTVRTTEGCYQDKDGKGKGSRITGKLANYDHAGDPSSVDMGATFLKIPDPMTELTTRMMAETRVRERTSRPCGLGAEGMVLRDLIKGNIIKTALCISVVINSFGNKINYYFCSPNYLMI
jgi:hypothetical protein